MEQRAENEGQPPQELINILRPHLDKVGPLMKLPADGSVAVYALYVQGATADPEGKVMATGDGTFIGPLDLTKREVIYRVYANHMPSLKERLEGAVSGKLLIVTCEVGAAGEGKKMHYAVIGVQ